MAKKFLTPIQSTVSTGTAPFIVASTTTVTNLNADLLDGQQGSYYAAVSSLSNYQPIDADLTAIAALSGTSGLLKKTAANTWTLDTTAYTTNTGTVTSVGVSVPTGLSVSGTPVTSSGTIAISLQSGYSIPTTTSQTNWNTAYTDRLKWDGNSTGLNATTGRTSLGLGNVENTALSTWAGTTNITTIGTISTGTWQAGNILPATDNTGVVGNATNTWNNGQFTNLTIDSTLNVRAAIDLADSDYLRFGSSDDTKMWYNGSTNIMNIELEAAAVSLNITDNGTNRVVITKSSGNIESFGSISAESGTTDNITSRTKSGFWQTATATTAEGWPETTNSWYHMFAATHSNTDNYYSLQLAAPFFSNKLYFRSTNGSGTTSWSEIATVDQLGTGGLDPFFLGGM